jgi:hypothetical protein
MPALPLSKVSDIVHYAELTETATSDADTELKNLAIDVIALAHGEPFVRAQQKIVERLRPLHANQIERELYERFLSRVVEVRYSGGWPPQDVAKVAGWLIVRILALVFNKTPRDVAQDLIDRYEQRHGES